METIEQNLQTLYDMAIRNAPRILMAILVLVIGFWLIGRLAKLLDQPETLIKVSELGNSSVNFLVRPWVKSEHYWDTYFYMHEHVKKAFDKNGVSIPFPQMDVHLDQ